MMKDLYVLSPAVQNAFQHKLPIVALESTVITHGLPHPDNLLLAQQMEEVVLNEGAVPATIALFGNKIHIGLTAEELTMVATASHVRKVSRRDFGIVLAQGEVGGTTVAGTLFAANQAGIKVFATGGIGGVHRGGTLDISADLPELGKTPMIVVCSGAKSILDLPATIEVLETEGVPVIGYQTSEFPAFFSTHSGLPVTARVETPLQIAQIAIQHWKAGINTAILVANPPPVDAAISSSEMDILIDQALLEAEKQGIKGADVTPFILGKINQLSSGTSLQANLALLLSNARLAAQIAVAIQPPANHVV